MQALPTSRARHRPPPGDSDCTISVSATTLSWTARCLSPSGPATPLSAVHAFCVNVGMMRCIARCTRALCSRLTRMTFFSTGVMQAARVSVQWSADLTHFSCKHETKVHHWCTKLKKMRRVGLEKRHACARSWTGVRTIHACARTPKHEKKIRSFKIHTVDAPMRRGRTARWQLYLVAALSRGRSTWWSPHLVAAHHGDRPPHLVAAPPGCRPSNWPPHLVAAVAVGCRRCRPPSLGASAAGSCPPWSTLVSVHPVGMPLFIAAHLGSFPC